MKVLVVNNATGQILFQQCPDDNNDEVLQLVTPLLVASKILMQELETHVRRIRIGTHCMFISTHLNVYTLLVLSTNTRTEDKFADHETAVRAFHKSCKEFIGLVCGLSWSLLHSNLACQTAFRNFVISWEKVVAQRPNVVLGVSGIPLELTVSTKDKLRQFVLADQVSRVRKCCPQLTPTNYYIQTLVILGIL